MFSVDKIYHAERCGICLVDYEKNEINKCLLLKCGHVFHEGCANTWIQQQSNCPLCKSRTIIPIFLKEILKEAGAAGVVGFRKAAKYLFATVLVVTIYAIVQFIINTIWPGRWPTTNEEMDAHIKEHGVILDLRKSEDCLKLGISLVSIASVAGAFYVGKTLNQRRIQQMHAFKQIDYRPI